MATISFWNNEKIDKNSSSAPLQTMVEQANSLSSVTNDYLQGQVMTYNNGTDKTITYCFTIIAPYLNQSRLTLFCIEQELDKEFPLKFYSEYFDTESPCTCADIDSFNTCLKSIISSDKASEMINGLIAKSRAVN